MFLLLTDLVKPTSFEKSPKSVLHDLCSYFTLWKISDNFSGQKGVEGAVPVIK